MENGELKRLDEMKNILLRYDLKSGLTPGMVRSILEELGPTFIKLGQILSTRMDLIPKEYCEELAKLRGHTKALPKEVIVQILRECYDDFSHVFSEVGECIGSASIAQVHRARLMDGTDVVVKVCRPGVYEKMEQDVRLLKKAIQIMHIHLFVRVIDLNAVLDEMLAVALEESNLLIERDHFLQFKKMNQDRSFVYVPQVFSDISNEKVLVMEYIDGIKIDDVMRLKKEGYDVLEVSYQLSDNYMKQALEDGFFHADPHADNLFLYQGKITYIDLGMVGVLSKNMRLLLKKCIRAIMNEEYDVVCSSLLLMSTHSKDVDMEKLEQDVASILEKYSNEDLAEIDVTKFVGEMFRMLQENHLKLDSSITMLVRGILVIESTLERLNPNLSLIQVILNYVFENELVIDSAKVMNGAKEIVNTSREVMALPKEIRQFFKSFNQNHGKVKIEMSASSKEVDKLENLLHEFIIGLLDASLILGYNLQKNIPERRVLLVFIVGLSIWLLIKMFIDFIRSGY